MKYFYEGLSWAVLSPAFAQKNQDSEGIKCENQALIISMATFANLSAASACFFCKPGDFIDLSFVIKPACWEPFRNI